MIRKQKLTVGEIYHICNKSIARFTIFNNENDYTRIKNMIAYYQNRSIILPFSKYIESADVIEKKFISDLKANFRHENKIVQIIAYCIMPTHMHLILKELSDNGISKYMSNILNSYAKYFNKKHKRKGPLWEGRFQNIHIKTEEQLLHLTRYLHLNPVVAGLIDNPEEWTASSYNEYLSKIKNNEKICDYVDLLKIEPSTYAKFVKDRISYQKELARIKNLLLEEETDFRNLRG